MLINSPGEGGGLWKIFKMGRKYGAGVDLYKRGFPIYFFQGLSFLHLEITSPFVKLHYAGKITLLIFA